MAVIGSTSGQHRIPREDRRVRQSARRGAWGAWLAPLGMERRLRVGTSAWCRGAALGWRSQRLVGGE